MPTNMMIRVSEDKELTDPRERLFAVQAEFRKAQAAMRRAREILRDTSVDGTHALKLALKQQIRAIQKMAEMLNKFGDRLQQKEKDR